MKRVAGLAHWAPSRLARTRARRFAPAAGTRRPPLPDGPYVVVGLARSGAAAAFALRARGHHVIGLDAHEPPGLERLRAAGVDVHAHASDERMQALVAQAQAVVKSPGVPGDAPALRAARDLGLLVLGELELAWRIVECEMIAITGTNGKTTTTELIGHLHRRAGLAVEVAGNVGRPLSTLAYRDVGALEAASAPQGATIVCEASSFQLEDTLGFAPEAAILLNLAPDHLDRHGTVAAYRAAKLRIFAHQRAQDIAMLPLGLDVDLRALGVNARELRFAGAPGAAPTGTFGAGDAAAAWVADGCLWWRGLAEPLLRIAELSLRGAHNVENALAAAAVCLERGMDAAAVRAGLRDFPGVAHRLEDVGVRDGVLYVNDSKATNIASTLVALRALSRDDPQSRDAPARPVLHVILGGQGKGQDFSALRAEVARRARAVYLIGEDAPLIAQALSGIEPPVVGCGDLDRALARASACARPGDVVLLSPGCASFDQFADFQARGDRFRELARAPATPAAGRSARS